MGTERDEVYSGPCRCGKGTLQIDYCQPDHAWPSGQKHWHECSVHCAACERLYVIQHRGRGFFYVEKAELKKLEELSHAAYKRGQTLLKQERVQALLAQATSLLNAQSSVAAVHRLLQSKGFSTNALPTFRKHWKGADAWLKDRISPYSVDGLLSLLGVKDAAISQEMGEIGKMQAASNTMPPTIKGPIYEYKQSG